MNTPIHQLEAYFADEATEDQVRAIEAWLHADPANARALVQELHFRELVGQHLRERSDHTSLALVELARFEAGALPVVVSSETCFDDQPPAHDKPLSRQAVLDAGRYVLSHAMHNRAVQWSLAAAAALALALTLAIVFAGSGDQTASTRVAQTPRDNRPLNPRSPAVPVATLTAQHDAQWEHDFDFGTPELRDTLYAGQRLTLRTGHAQLTTHRDATLLLEAPCTVELIDNPNAIRLISGKLVGNVASESAKGLLIRTPHMDVTDLGTRFGVACDADATRLRVFEGEVLASTPGSDQVQRAVKASESVRVRANSDAIQPIDDAPDRFVTTLAALADRPALTGDIRYEPSIPSDLRIGAYEHNHILLFTEQIGVSLKDPLPVNITQPGTYADQPLLDPALLEAGPTVDTYLIHLDTLNVEGAGRVKSATIRFERPILGLITSGERMARTNPMLGLASVRYGSETAANYTGLDKTNANRESVTLSDDRLTLTLNISTGQGIDQFRVLVANEPLN